METIFKVGDRVFDIRYGWGIVQHIDLSANYPIFCGFDKHKQSYSTDGKVLDNTISTLSFTEYTLEGFSQERPEELPKKGDIVWVRNEFPSEWEIGYFFKKQGNTYYTSASKNSQGWRGAGLEIRTTNPYSNEQ